MAKTRGKTPAKKAATRQKSSTASRANVSKPAKPRRPKRPQYKSFRLQKRIKHPVRLSNVFRLTRQAADTLWSHKRLFLGVTLVYGLLNLLLVQGITGGTDVSSLKQILSDAFAGNFEQLATGLGVFAILVSSAGNATSQTAGAYQLFIGIIASLAIIWALRQTLAGNKLRIRDAYYGGMFPLIPFVLVLLVVVVQLLPLMIGSTIYNIVVSQGIAVLFLEKLLWALLYGLLALLTFYMLSSSLFALYIVTLPDMTPLKALRSARELVRYRRWTVMRKVLALPVILLVAAAAIMVPIIVWLTPLAQWVFFLLTMSALTAVHAYMYTLYRELLNE